MFFVDTEITQGGSADSQLHRGQLSSAGGAAQLPRSEQGKAEREYNKYPRLISKDC